MGGTLSVESAVGVGSTFTLTLPHDPAPALEPPLSALPGWAGQRVLVAESDATNRRILAAMLSRWTLTVQTVPSVAEALGRLRAEPWDLVILNRQLPGVEDAGPFAVGNDGTASARSVPDGRIGPVAVRISTPIRSKCLHRTLSQALGGGAPAEIAASLLDPGLAQRMPLRILVADDNPVNQRVAGRLLERWGYHPGLACNGLEVLEAVRNHCYDLVLLDVQMPEMDGIEAARRICAEMPPGRRPRIIALTAGVFKQDRERCMEAGMDGFLSKPIVVGELKAALEQCFVKLLPSAPPTDSPPPRRYARIQVS
jgi:CheY-like chemotaxis protein